MSMSFVLGLQGMAELQATIKRIQVCIIYLFIYVIFYPFYSSVIIIFWGQMFFLLEENNGSMGVLSKSTQGVDNNGVKLNTYNEDDIANHIFHANNKTEHSNNVVIDILNATAKWTDIKTNNSLEDINLTIESGRLVAVIGPVGAGKVRPVLTRH